MRKKDGISKQSDECEFSKAAACPVLPVPLLFQLLVRPSSIAARAPVRHEVWAAVCGQRKDRKNSLIPSRNIGICPSDVEIVWEATSAVARRLVRALAPAETCTHLQYTVTQKHQHGGVKDGPAITVRHRDGAGLT